MFTTNEDVTNHIVCIVMDSCRFDSFVAAKTPNIDKLGEVERRYSYASWTAPSHNTFAMGLLVQTYLVLLFCKNMF